MNNTIKTEFFSINKSKMPKLFIYKIESTSYNVKQLGGKLKYGLNKMFNNNIFGWNKEKDLLVSDFNIPNIPGLLEELWKDESYQSLKNIRQLSGDIDNMSIAEYIVSYIKSKYNWELLDLEKKYKINNSTNNFCVNLIIDFRAWDINNEPCISISIRNKIIYANDLLYYYHNENKKIEDMQVIVIRAFSNYNSTGTIVKVYGKLKDESKRLYTATKNENMKKLIQKNIKKNPDDPVVQIKFNNSGNTYDYVMEALKPVIRDDTIFKTVELRDTSKKFKIEPDLRYNIILNIYDIIKKSGFFNGNMDNNYNKNIFNNLPEEYYNPKIKVGNNRTVTYKPYFIPLLNSYGIYFKNEKFKDNKLKILIINDSKKNMDNYLKCIEKKFGELKIDIDIIKILNKNFDDAFEEINNYNFDILIFIGGYDFNDRDYFNYKSMLLSKYMQSQFLIKAVDNIKYSVSNVVLGILGKTGNIPFILDNEKYADYIVGIDISRERKKNNVGTRNIAAMTRIYSHDGTMVKYKIVSDTIDGETIPEETLYKIYMDDELKNKEVIFHRDGPFRGNEIKILNKIANKLNSKFYFIEINKRNTPRLYKCDNGKTYNPDLGTCMGIGNNEYIIVTSETKIGTVQPLRVKFYNIGFENGMKSIYNLISMDYGSLKRPKIPITTHYSDKISYYALRGILPGNTEGNIPFWL